MQDTKLSSLYTTDTNENAYETHKTLKSREFKDQSTKNHQELLEDPLRHMNECMQLAPNLR